MPDTKIAIALRDDLLDWQKLNVTAFLTSGVTAATPSIIGERYVDGEGTEYLAMSGQPMIVLVAPGKTLTKICRRARERDVRFAIFIDDMFTTYDDVANRRTVEGYDAEELPVAGIALRGPRKTVDTITKGARLHP